MPLITSKPKGTTLFNQFTFTLSPTEFTVTKADNAEEFMYNLASYLNDGHDLTAPITINFSFALPPGGGITIGNPNMDMVCTFQASATFAHFVATEIAIYDYDMADLNFLKEYNIDWNQNFEFSGSYNGFTPFGGTPLHLAALEAEHTDTIEFFIEMDAEPNLLNSKGQTPLDIAQEIGSPEVADFLQQYINEHPDLQEPLTFADYLQSKITQQNEAPTEINLADIIEENLTIPGLELKPQTEFEAAPQLEAVPQEPSYLYQAYETVSDYFTSFFHQPTVDATPANEILG